MAAALFSRELVGIRSLDPSRAWQRRDGPVTCRIPATQHSGLMSPPQPNRLGPLPSLIFASRWLQLPLYLGLIVAQAVYVWQFGVELVHLVSEVFLHGGEAEQAAKLAEGGPTAEVAIMLIVLGLIDVVMISNLL